MFLVRLVYLVQYCTVFSKNIHETAVAAAMRSFYNTDKYSYCIRTSILFNENFRYKRGELSPKTSAMQKVSPNKRLSVQST